MIELGAIAGIPVVVIFACLIKCAVEVGNADEHPTEVQNLLFMQCVTDCLLPSGLPDPDRYKDDEETEDGAASQPNDEDRDFEFPDEEGMVGFETAKVVEIAAYKVKIQTDYRERLTILTIEDAEKGEKFQEENFFAVYRPDRSLKAEIESLAQDVLSTGADVDARPLKISIIVPEVRRDAINTFREELIGLLQQVDDQWSTRTNRGAIDFFPHICVPPPGARLHAEETSSRQSAHQLFDPMCIFADWRRDSTTDHSE